jgi:hypothetical protein
LERAGSGAGFVSQRNGCEDTDLYPDPYQNVTDPRHCSGNQHTQADWIHTAERDRVRIVEKWEGGGGDPRRSDELNGGEKEKDAKRIGGRELMQEGPMKKRVRDRK